MLEEDAKVVAVLLEPKEIWRRHFLSRFHHDIFIKEPVPHLCLVSCVILLRAASPCFLLLHLASSCTMSACVTSVFVLLIVGTIAPTINMV